MNYSNRITRTLLTLLACGALFAGKAQQMDHSSMQHQHMQHGARVLRPPREDFHLPPIPDLLQEAKDRAPLALEEMQKSALEHNPTLQQAQAIVRRSSGQARQAGLWPNPSVGYQGEQIRGGSGGGGEQGAFVQQNIILGGKLSLRRGVYSQQVREDEVVAEEQRYRVLGDVGRRFYAALAAQAIVDLRRDLLGLAMDAVQTAQQLANVGQADAPDVLQAEVEAEQAQVDYGSAQRTYLQQFRILTAYAGTPNLPLARLSGDLERVPSLNESELLDGIWRDSPSIRRARQEVTRAQAAIRSARREAIPDLSLRAGVQQNYEAINQTGRPTGAQAFASAGVNLPIFNRNQGNVSAASADLERAQADLQRTEMWLRSAAQPYLQNCAIGRLQADRYKNEMIPRAKRAYELYLDRYRNMAAAYPQVLVSQRTLFQLQVDYLLALERIWDNAVALQNFTLDGGLDAPMGTDPVGMTLNLPVGGGLQ